MKTRAIALVLGVTFSGAPIACGGSTALDGGSGDSGAKDATAAGDAAPSDAGTGDGAIPEAGALPYTVLATGQGLPSGIAVDDANVYWVDVGVSTAKGKTAGPYVDGALMSCAKSGCPGGPTTLASGLMQDLSVGVPAPIVVANATVYFGATDADGAGELLTCATGGCKGAPSLFASAFAWGLATNGASLFWTESSESDVAWCPLAGCGGAPNVLFAPAADASVLPVAMGITADDTAAYWIMSGANDNLVSCAVGGCNDAPSPLGNTIPDYVQIVSDAQNLYFTNTSPLGLGAILTCPKTGCPGAPRTIAPARSRPIGIAVDATYVYWTELGNDFEDGGEVAGAAGVYACPLAGCTGAPIAIASGQDGVAGVAVDDTRVYWVALGANGGEVRSVGKP